MYVLTWVYNSAHVCAMHTCMWRLGEEQSLLMFLGHGFLSAPAPPRFFCWAHTRDWDTCKEILFLVM